MNTILLLGVSDAGKSTYGAQLLERFENPNVATALRLRKSPNTYRVLQAAHEALLKGKYPDHTGYETHESISLPLVDVGGYALDLDWPEFAGDAFNDHILKGRFLPEAWVDRTKVADGVLLMIRPAIEPDAPGVKATSAGVLERTPGTDAEQTGSVSLAPDARYVEALQLFALARNLSRRTRATWPLAVVLSCWDEVEEIGPTDVTVLPRDVLFKNYPLLSMYLEGTWVSQDLNVFGLSATGRKLDKEGDKRFVDANPSTQGKVVVENGASNQDLTLPLAWLLERLRATQP